MDRYCELQQLQDGTGVWTSSVRLAFFLRRRICTRHESVEAGTLVEQGSLSLAATQRKMVLGGCEKHVLCHHCCSTCDAECETFLNFATHDAPVWCYTF